MTFERTIDWHEYWTDADDEAHEDASPSAELVVDPLLTFLEERGDPDELADIGCGTGTVPFAVSDRYPGATVVGYDAAESIVAANREEATERGRSNVDFRTATLPRFEPEERYDVVSCCYTLCYVPAIERALEALYDAVAPGGDLVITYHNTLAQLHFQGIAADPHEHLGEDSPWDPDRFEERFAALLDGESLLSHERIHDVLGTWPQSVWSVVGDSERYPAWRHNPLVYVPK